MRPLLRPRSLLWQGGKAPRFFAVSVQDILLRVSGQSLEGGLRPPNSMNKFRMVRSAHHCRGLAAGRDARPTRLFLKREKNTGGTPVPPTSFPILASIRNPELKTQNLPLAPDTRHLTPGT